MKSKSKSTALPELRFPEFRHAGKWNDDKLEKLYSFKSTNSFSRDKLTFEQGSVKNIHYGDIHTKFSSHFDIKKEEVPYIIDSESLAKVRPDSYCEESDVIFADASEDIDGVGKCIEIINLNDQSLLSGLHTILARQKEGKFITGFAGHLFQSGRMRQKIQNEAQGAKVLGISGGRLASIDICYPVEKKEQQKISDCLSSLDELIAYEGQKLETLQDHKKGLMQKLFPAEGETLPKFRFPEFKDTPEWKIQPLHKIASYENGKAHEKGIVESGEYIVVNSKFISSEGQTLKYSNEAHCLADKDDLLMVLSDVPNGRAIAKCFCVDQDNRYTVNQRICRIKARKVSGKFLYQILDRHKYYLSFDDGVKQTNLRKDDVLSCPLCYPPAPEEQKKILGCLSSLDDLIKTKSQKIEALQEQKKGLMQKLFPSIDEAMG